MKIGMSLKLDNFKANEYINGTILLDSNYIEALFRLGHKIHTSVISTHEILQNAKYS